MKRTSIVLTLGLLLIAGTALAAAPGDPAPANAPLAAAASCPAAAPQLTPAVQSPASPDLAGATETQVGVCCVRAAFACARSCGTCGVASFSCSLDFPGCTGFCTCNPCS